MGTRKDGPSQGKPSPNRLDLAGQKFGEWTALRFAGRRKGNGRWICRCSCGTERAVFRASLLTGGSRSCGCARGALLAGQRINSWEILKDVGRGAAGEKLWLCRCSCGATSIVRTWHLLKGRSKKCQSCANRIHGYSGTGEWGSWKAMLSRVRHAARSAPGGKQPYRGVTVCARWDPQQGGGFENFFADLGWRPPGASLDRIDPAGNYEPANCRWATSSEQNRNRKPHLVCQPNGISYVWKPREVSSALTSESSQA